MSYSTDAGSIRLALESGSFTPEEALDALITTSLDPASGDSAGHHNPLAPSDPSEARPFGNAAGEWWGCFGAILARAAIPLLTRALTFGIKLLASRLIP